MARHFTQVEQLTLTGPNRTLELRYNADIQSVRIMYAPQDFSIYAGHGTSEVILQVRAGDRGDINLANPENVLTIGWAVDPPLPQAVYAKPLIEVSAGFLGSGDGFAQPVMLAQSDSLGQIRAFYPWGNSDSLTNRSRMTALVDIGAGPFSVIQGQTPWTVDNQHNPSYSAVYKAANPPEFATLAVGAGARVALATLWNDPATGLYLDLLKADAVIVDTTVAGEVGIGLYRISVAPTVGTVRTIIKHDTADGASIADVRLSPTATIPAGGNAAYWAGYKLGITGAVSVVNPAPAPPFLSIYDRNTDPSERHMRAAPGEGWAITAACENATTIRFAARMTWEENVA
jgi:hypothetical protein